MCISDWSSAVCSSDLRSRPTVRSGASGGKMDRLTAMRHFLAVVEGGSFSNAARRLGVANATVTQSIKGLEAHLGVRLMNRTTRQMKLTSEGNTYADRCRHLLNELDGIEREIIHLAKAPCGQLRIEVPSAIRSEEHTSELQSLMRISY